VAYLLIASTKIEGNLTGFVACLPAKYTPQYRWLEAEFPKVNMSETPWLIVGTTATTTATWKVKA
jgi:hypothetical protein